MTRSHACGVVAAVSLLAGEARAECTWGEVEAISQNLPVTRMQLDRGQEHPGLLDARACQYRVFLDGATFSFDADAPFLGGIVWIFPYEDAGVPRQEAAADLQLLEDRVWLATGNGDGTYGEWVEQPLECTPIKALLSPVFGRIAFKHCSYITALPAGEYQTLWESTYDGEFNGTAVVNLVIE